jgi:hypothetical protein
MSVPPEVEGGPNRAARSLEGKLKFYRESSVRLDNLSYVARINQKKRREQKRAEHKRNALTENFFTCGSNEALEDHREQWLEDSAQKRYEVFVRHKEVAVSNYKVKRDANPDVRRARRRAVQRGIDRQKNWLQHCMLAAWTVHWKRVLSKRLILRKSKEQMKIVCTSLQHHMDRLSRIVGKWKVRVAKKLLQRKETNLILLFLRQFTAGKDRRKKFALCVLKFRRMKLKVTRCQRRWRERMQMRAARMVVLNLRFQKVERGIWEAYEQTLIAKEAAKIDAAKKEEAAAKKAGIEEEEGATKEKPMSKSKTKGGKSLTQKEKTRKKLNRSSKGSA